MPARFLTYTNMSTQQILLFAWQLPTGCFILLTAHVLFIQTSTVRTVYCTHFMANAITKNPRVFILKEISFDQKIYHHEPSENPTLELPKIRKYMPFLGLATCATGSVLA